MADKYISGEEYQRISSSQPRNQSNMPISKIVIGAVVLVIVCGISFYSGVKYQKSHTPKTVASSGSIFSSGGGGQGGFASRGGGFGQVTSVSPTSITITNQRSGANQTFSISSSTTISDSGNTVTTSDIQTGDTVIIRTSGSGSTAATSILVNPSFGGGFGGGSSGQSQSSGTTTQ